MTKCPEQVHDLPERPAYSFSQVFETGLLWYINATAFHPHGLALAVEGDGLGWSLHAAPEGEPITFPDEPFTHERFRAFQALVAEARRQGVVPEGAVAAFHSETTP